GMGVGGGYALGRRKKLKLAVGLGAWLLGKRIRLDPQALLMEGLQKLAENPDVMKLSDEVRGQLFQAARSAATKGLTDQLTRLTTRLTPTTQSILPTRMPRTNLTCRKTRTSQPSRMSRGARSSRMSRATTNPTS